MLSMGPNVGNGGEGAGNDWIVAHSSICYRYPYGGKWDGGSVGKDGHDCLRQQLTEVNSVPEPMNDSDNDDTWGVWGPRVESVKSSMVVDDAPAKSPDYGVNGWKTSGVSELDGARASKAPAASGWRQDPLPDLSRHEAFMRITNLLDASRGQVLPVWGFKSQGI